MKIQLSSQEYILFESILKSQAVILHYNNIS